MDILLVEDNEELAELLKVLIEKKGFSVDVRNSGSKALEYLEYTDIKLILLDVMLKGNMDGFTVLESVRKYSAVPVLIMSACTNKEDKLNGYRLGADDYIEKPVDPDILLAKVRAQMVRTYGSAIEEKVIKSGKITIDTVARKVFLNDRLLAMNLKEYEILKLLVRNKGKTMQKDYIFKEVWGIHSHSENQTLTVHIKMLRDKIEEDSKKPKLIQTIWGVGYRYEEI